MSEYTLEEIKMAFWGTFHQVGEIWFDYIGTEEEQNSHTEEWWDTFLEELIAAKNRG